MPSNCVVLAEAVNDTNRTLRKINSSIKTEQIKMHVLATSYEEETIIEEKLVLRGKLMESNAGDLDRSNKKVLNCPCKTPYLRQYERNDFREIFSGTD